LTHTLKCYTHLKENFKNLIKKLFYFEIKNPLEHAAGALKFEAFKLLFLT
jgi:hypothetical protein